MFLKWWYPFSITASNDQSVLSPGAISLVLTLLPPTSARGLCEDLGSAQIIWDNLFILQSDEWKHYLHLQLFLSLTM